MFFSWVYEKRLDYMNVDDFSVDYDSIDVHNVLGIHTYLMKKHNIKWCLNLLKKCLLG